MNQNTEIIPCQYNLNSELGAKLNALRNALVKHITAGKYHKAIQACEHALKLQYDACEHEVKLRYDATWLGCLNTLKLCVHYPPR